MPHAFLRRRTTPLRLVIFDCDGVLVDSEPVANRVTAEAVTALGWPMTPAESEHHFLGLSFTDMQPIIAQRIGRPIPDSWKTDLMRQMIEELAQHATAIPGAIEALHALTASGLPWRVASNSSHEEMHVKFTRLGILATVAGRLHSHRDVARGKPAPDLVLATAAAHGVSPAECLVIEDSVPGATAAAAAGMDCLGYVPQKDGVPQKAGIPQKDGAPHHTAPRLRAVGAVPFTSMFDLPDILTQAPR